MTKKNNNKKSKKKKSLKNTGQTKREKSNSNLIQYKKGQSGNLKGRPKLEASIPHNIREVGKEMMLITISEMNPKTKKMLSKQIITTRAKAVVYKMYAKAVGGNEKAAKILWEREIGKPSQTIAVGLIEGEDINVIFEGADFLNGEDAFQDAEDADFTEASGENGEIEKENEK